MKKTSIILLLFVLMGCGGPLKKHYTNFTAYYNTFYNAKKDFRAGLKKVEQQPFSLDLQKPIRAHPKPVLAGSEDFNNAIDNGAQILRRFPESKWTDNALLLIGKSYYYLQEDFLALQKFEELLALPSGTPLQQKAVIWKGRTLLDIKAYSRGIQFLEDALDDGDGGWDPQNKAYTEVLLAEHLAMLGQWEKAADYLEPALLAIDGGALKGRGYLLLGQLYQNLNDYDRAFQAYSQVRRNFPDYEYIYWADLKKGEVARLSGRVDLAESIFNDMLNDDKNFNRRGEINYHLAGIYEDRGDFEQAEVIYNNILSNPPSENSENISGNIYNRLGHIYSEHYHNFKVAAAYFDSSSAQSTQQVQNGAQKLASAYGRYVSLKNEITQMDSLLALGALKKNELHTRLIELRQERKENIEQSQNTIQQRNNTLNNARKEDVYQTPGPNAGTSRFGFLNYHSQELVQRERQKFMAIWGNRPLVDNWRRKEAITHSVLNDEEDRSPENGLKTIQNENATDAQLGINVADIPRTPESRRALEQKKLNAQYRLGSLFFLTLNQPDSAAYYYHQILRQSTSSDLQAQARYSLYELYNLQNEPDSAALYHQQILQRYPNSRYASRLQTSDNAAQTASPATDSTATLREQVQQILQHNRQNNPDSETAARLRNLAIKNQVSTLAPSIYYRAIRTYIRAAKQPDSVRSSPDSLLAPSPAGTDTLSYRGRKWDKVREVLDEFKRLFPDAPQNRQVDIWRTTLKNPDQFNPVFTCKELNSQPVIIGSKAVFTQSVSLPDKVKRMNLSGDIKYRFLIGADGSVESFNLVSTPTYLGIEEAYERAIENKLQFKPLTQNGQPVRASCIVAFSINR